jgi:hypothetical protein
MIANVHSVESISNAFHSEAQCKWHSPAVQCEVIEICVQSEGIGAKMVGVPGESYFTIVS